MQILTICMGLATSIILARVLGPENFGLYSLILSIITVISLPIDQGIRQLVTREISNYQHEKNWSLFRGFLRRSSQLIIIVSIAIIGILGVISFYQATWESDDFWTLLTVGLIISPFLGFNALYGAFLRGLGYSVLSQLPQLLIRPGIHLAFVVCLFIYGFLSPVTAIVSQGLSISIAVIIGILLLRQHLPQDLFKVTPDYRNKEWFRAWVPFTLLSAASILNNQVNILLLGWLGTNEEVGAFRVADRGAQLVVLSLTTVNLVIAPYITRAYQEGKYDRLQVLSRKSARAALMIALPIALPMIFFGENIIAIVFGSDYVELAVMPLTILVIAQLVNVFFGSVGLFLTMSGFERDTFRGQMYALSINILAGLVLIPFYGAIGAAYAAAIGLITWNLILSVKFIRRLKLRPTAL